MSDIINVNDFTEYIEEEINKKTTNDIYNILGEISKKIDELLNKFREIIGNNDNDQKQQIKLELKKKMDILLFLIS